MKKIKKRYTLKEFQAWLSGIEEIQPDDWHPDLEQWKLIRDRLGNIIADVQEKIVEREVVREVPIPMDTPNQHLPPPPALVNPNVPPPLIPPPVIPDGGMTPAAAAALRGEMPAGGAAGPGGGGKVHKIPTDPATLDPSAPGNPYATSFA